MKKTLTIITCCMMSGLLLGHDGHVQAAQLSKTDAFMYWLGTFHPVVLNFPVALITMTCFAELFFWKTKNPLFDHAARFMLLAAAIMSIPTVIFGLALSYNASYADMQEEFFWWHRFFGLITMGLAILTAYIREYQGSTGAYFSFLTASFLSLFATGFLGGNLTFDVVQATTQLIHTF